MADTFLYFAYGSNMLTRRLTARTPSAVVFGPAFAEGYRLTFAKVSSDGSGKCDIERTENPEDRVYGVLFRVDTSEAECLDAAEGLGHGYEKGSILTTSQEGPTSAITYFATKTNTTLRPYEWYKAFVVEGAVEHQLPGAYIARLRDLPAQTDLNATRREMNERLLMGS